MERVETLLNKLRDQIDQNASVDQLLIVVQMLQSELMHLKGGQLSPSPSVAVNIPPSFEEAGGKNKIEERTVEVLQIDEAEVAAELDEIKKNIETRNKIGSQNKPPMVFDPVEDTPTLTHQKPAEKPKELHETIAVQKTASLNDKLKQPKVELTDTMQEASIKDLRKAIGVNDRFLFINELFRGDEAMYERSIKTINGFSIYPEAEFWIKREMKLKLGWNDNNHVVKQFDQLIRRRFS